VVSLQPRNNTMHVCTVFFCCAGRINKKVHMGNLAAAEALAMVKHCIL
jgi:hypothetical protein